MPFSAIYTQWRSAIRGFTVRTRMAEYWWWHQLSLGGVADGCRVDAQKKKPGHPPLRRINFSFRIRIFSERYQGIPCSSRMHSAGILSKKHLYLAHLSIAEGLMQSRSGSRSFYIKYQFDLIPSVHLFFSWSGNLVGISR